MSAQTKSPESVETQDLDGTAEIEPNYDDVNTPVIALVAALSAIVTLAVIIAVQAFFFQYQETLLKDRVVDQKTDAIKSMLTEQLQSVSEYGVINKEQGVYAIPIDRAMEIVVKDVNKDRGTDAAPNNDAPVPPPTEPTEEELPKEDPTEKPDEPTDSPSEGSPSEPIPAEPMDDNQDVVPDPPAPEPAISDPTTDEPAPAPVEPETTGNPENEPTESDFD